jgi:predicted nucleotidyltransferase
MKKIIKNIAIETGHWRILSFFYNVYYKIAAEVSIHFIKKIPGVSSIFVRRSFSGPGWIAGYSDIDLAIVIKRLTPDAEVPILTKIHSALSIVRIIFPVISAYVFCLNETDFDRWLSYGNIRRLEFSRWVKRHG